MRQDAGDRDTSRETPGLEPARRVDLEAAIRRWEDQPEELERLLRELDGKGPDSVPSYRIGAAEGTVLFPGLNGLGAIVTETLELLHAEQEQRERAVERERSEQFMELLRALMSDRGDS